MTAPVSHVQESVKLEPAADVDLFEVQLRGSATVFYFWGGPTRTWQGHEYETLPCKLSGDGASVENQQSRPRLTVINPDKIFGPFAAAGYFDLASVYRHRILRTHLEANVNTAQTRLWIVGRVSGVNNQGLELELRNPTDMPAWKTPRRTYSPPEFPFVVI